MEGEAECVVAGRECLCVIDAAGQVGEVDAREGVDSARVAADAKEFGVFEGGHVEVGGEVGDGVFVADGAEEEGMLVEG